MNDVVIVGEHEGLGHDDIDVLFGLHFFHVLGIRLLADNVADGLVHHAVVERRRRGFFADGTPRTSRRTHFVFCGHPLILC